MFLSFSLFRGSISKGLRSIHSQKPMRIDDKRSFLNKYEAFLFDCDGVIWKGDSLIAGVVDTLSYLRRHNKKIYFVTNNSTLSRAGFHKKFTKLGIDAHINGAITICDHLYSVKFICLSLLLIFQRYYRVASLLLYICSSIH